MKKRRFICFLIFTMFILGFLILDVAFGQSSKLIDHSTYNKTLRREKVRSLLPDFLRVFNGSEMKKRMEPRHVNTFLNNPLFLRRSVPGTDDEFIGLLYVDKDFRTLFGADPFYTVLKSSREIGRLLKWFEALPPLPEGPGSQKVTTPPRATTLEIVSEKNQSGEVDKPLAQPLVVGVLDQYGKPLKGIEVTFAVTLGGGQLSGYTIHTDKYGQAQATLTLGRERNNSVRASVSGLTPQTFTATATALPPPSEPEPVVSVQPSTAEPPLPPMYWIEGNTIYHRPTGGVKTMFPVSVDGTLTGGLAVDTVGEKVYWTEKKSDGTGRVRIADLDGENVETFKGIFAVPYNIAFDAGKRRLYWTNSFGKIQSINVDGTDFRGDFLAGLENPQHIAFDMKTSRLYWTEMDADGIWSIFNTYAPGVAKGTASPRYFEKKVDLGAVRGIAVFDDVVYWTEETNDSGSIRSVNREGFNEKLRATTKSVPGGIAVDAVGEKVYWTTSHGIQSALLTGETVDILEETPAGIALGGMTRVPAAPAAPSLSPAVSVENTLLANYPNPFNPETWIPYQLSASADVSVSIYAVDGCLVRRLDLGHQVEGVYRSRSRAAYWDGRNEFGERVASGLYFYTLTAGDFTATRKMLIRK